MGIILLGLLVGMLVVGTGKSIFRVIAQLLGAIIAVGFVWLVYVVVVVTVIVVFAGPFTRFFLHQ